MSTFLDKLIGGAPGADGAIWRDGAGAPDNAVGIDGDYYLRTSNGDLYKRISGVYSVIENIKGPAGAAGAAGAPGADGAAGGSVAMPWSPVDYMSANPDDWPGNGAGSTTSAVTFAVTEALTITGARFAWGDIAATNVKVSLWTTDATAGHTRQRNVTVAVTGLGIYTATFASPFTVPLHSINRAMHIAMWDTSGTKYTQAAPVVTIMPLMPIIVGKVHFQSLKSWGAGDVEPNSTAAAEQYPIEPIFAP